MGNLSEVKAPSLVQSELGEQDDGSNIPSYA